MLAAIFFRPLIGLWTGGTLERGLIGFILLCNMHQSWLRGLNQFTTITFFCLSFFSRENAPILAVESGQPTDLDGSWRWRIAGRYGRDARLVRRTHYRADQLDAISAVTDDEDDDDDEFEQRRQLLTDVMIIILHLELIALSWSLCWSIVRQLSLKDDQHYEQ